MPKVGVLSGGSLSGLISGTDFKLKALGRISGTSAGAMAEVGTKAITSLSSNSTLMLILRYRNNNAGGNAICDIKIDDGTHNTVVIDDIQSSAGAVGMSVIFIATDPITNTSLNYAILLANIATRGVKTGSNANCLQAAFTVRLSAQAEAAGTTYAAMEIYEVVGNA